MPGPVMLFRQRLSRTQNLLSAFVFASLLHRIPGMLVTMGGHRNRKWCTRLETRKHSVVYRYSKEFPAPRGFGGVTSAAHLHHQVKSPKQRTEKPGTARTFSAAPPTLSFSTTLHSKNTRSL
jgi:hypothetical protein